jgi:hypothetical protein
MDEDTSRPEQIEVKRRGRHTEDIACPDIHKKVFMLKEMSEAPYFYESYVARKGTAYNYPKRCDLCQMSVTIAGR